VTKQREHQLHTSFTFRSSIASSGAGGYVVATRDSVGASCISCSTLVRPKSTSLTSELTRSPSWVGIISRCLPFHLGGGEDGNGSGDAVRSGAWSSVQRVEVGVKGSSLDSSLGNDTEPGGAETCAMTNQGRKSPLTPNCGIAVRTQEMEVSRLSRGDVTARDGWQTCHISQSNRT
jgi:hypothetical protein